LPQPVRVRIAPSPTGNLHLGTARTALYNYLYARRHNGKFVLRLEDTDEERSQDVYTKDIIEGFHWLGLSWDEGPDIGGPHAPYKQTDKIDRYSHLANQLISNNLAYLSFETQEELAALKEQQKSSGQAPRYDNRGRNLTEREIEQYQAESRIPSIRLIVDEPRIVSWHDHIKGEISISTSDLGGDFIIVKSNGVAVYNFAVVIDDIDMKITHVIRGEDHIHNTAKQILLYEALGEKPPAFGHTALIFDTERHKLSKRHHGEAVHIDRYRVDGYMPEAMVNYLAQMSWTPPDGTEMFTLEEAAKKFDLDRVSKSPAVFDLARLKWFNSHYIRSLPLSLITDRALPYLSIYDLSGFPRPQLEELIATVRDGLTVLSEVQEAASFFFQSPLTVPQDLQEAVLSTTSARNVLDRCLQNLSHLPWGDHKGCKAIVDSIGKELGLKGKELYWPLRAALSGKVQGPDLGSMISILGETRVRARLESALPLCHSI
jgi:nondiscriminating glutamyl-tRNA synthetase